MKRIGLCAMVVWASALTGAAFASEPDVMCQSKKNREAGELSFCLQKAEASYARRQDDDKYAAEVKKCNERFFGRWEKCEKKAEPAACPDGIADPNALVGFIAEHSARVAAALAGDGLPPTCADAGGVEYAGNCWFLAAGAYERCSTICENVGLLCNLEAIRDLIGSNGALGLCTAVVDLLDPAGAPHPGKDWHFPPARACIPITPAAGSGCGLIDGEARRTTSPSTNCTANGTTGGGCSTWDRRVCACR
jgi:hypothetical protein